MGAAPQAAKPVLSTCEVAWCSEDGTVLRVDNVVVTITRRNSSPVAVRVARQLGREIVQGGSSMTILNIVAEGVGAPPREALDEIKRMNAELGQHVSGSVTVLEGEGMGRAMMRMVARSIITSLSKNHPRTMLATVEDAAPWVEQRSGTPRARLLEQLAPCRSCNKSGCCQRFKPST